jgi:hypothetical protein
MRWPLMCRTAAQHARCEAGLACSSSRQPFRIARLWDGGQRQQEAHVGQLSA